MTTIIPTTYILDPDADLDFGFDWSDWLEDEETLVSSSWVVDPVLDIDTHDESYSDFISVIWLRNIVENALHKVTNSVVTSSTPPRKDDRSFYVRGIER